MVTARDERFRTLLQRGLWHTRLTCRWRRGNCYIMHSYYQDWFLAFALYDVSLLHCPHVSARHSVHIAVCCRYHALLLITACNYIPAAITMAYVVRNAVGSVNGVTN